MGTSTSSFGVGRREGHDASAFYDRFPAPEISDDDRIAEPAVRDHLWVGDARDMDSCGDVADGSVALVVTSPPYFAGKDYEAVLGQGQGHVPGDYLAYLEGLGLPVARVHAVSAGIFSPGPRNYAHGGLVDGGGVA